MSLAYFDRDGSEFYPDWDKPEHRERVQQIWSLENRRVLNNYVGRSGISTVLLVTDHRSSLGEGRPIIFETMIFGGLWDGQQVRYCTIDEATRGHNAIVAACRRRRWNPFVGFPFHVGVYR